MTKPAFLEISHVSRRFGEFVAVNDVSIDVKNNTVHSIIGPNGAGKTTLFNLLTGVLPVSGGAIVFNGLPLNRMKPNKRLVHGLSRAFQISSAFRKLSVRENVWLAVRGAKKRMQSRRGHWSGEFLEERTDDLLEQFGLTVRARNLSGALSHGQQRSLEFAMTMASEPDLVLLDEPTSGVGPDDILRFTRLIRQIGTERCVVLVEHNMNIAMDISDHIAVLAHGSVLASGSSDDIRQDPKVKAAYLGVRRHA